MIMKNELFPGVDGLTTDFIKLLWNKVKIISYRIM